MKAITSVLTCLCLHRGRAGKLNDVKQLDFSNMRWSDLVPTGKKEANAIVVETEEVQGECWSACACACAYVPCASCISSGLIQRWLWIIVSGLARRTEDDVSPPVSVE